MVTGLSHSGKFDSLIIMDILLDMKLHALFLVALATLLLSGCQTCPTAQPLILTCEDMALKRRPYDPVHCSVRVDRCVRVDYGK